MCLSLFCLYYLRPVRTAHNPKPLTIKQGVWQAFYFFAKVSEGCLLLNDRKEIFSGVEDVVCVCVQGFEGCSLPQGFAGLFVPGIALASRDVPVSSCTESTAAVDMGT